VAYPWEMVVERPGQATRPLPPGTMLTDVFDELGGELLILGAPGAGKTTMLLDLARTLLGQAERDTAHPIPVVFSLSLWEEQHSSFADWLENELSDKYGVPKKVGRAWIDGGHIIPLLDGLDEVKNERRDTCVAHINTFWQEHGRSLVVCSRLA